MSDVNDKVMTYSMLQYYDSKIKTYVVNQITQVNMQNITVEQINTLINNALTDYTPDGVNEEAVQELIDAAIPDVSNFITDTVDSLVNYYKKDETYTQEEVNDLIGAIKSIKYEVTNMLPLEGESNIIYLVPKLTGEDKNIYDEYIYTEATGYEKIGDTKIDLSDYYNKEEVINKITQLIEMNNANINGNIDAIVERERNITNESINSVANSERDVTNQSIASVVQSLNVVINDLVAQTIADLNGNIEGVAERERKVTDEALAKIKTQVEEYDGNLTLKANQYDLEDLKDRIDNEVIPGIEDNAQGITNLNNRMPELDEAKTNIVNLGIKDTQLEDKIDALKASYDAHSQDVSDRWDKNEAEIEDLKTKATLHHGEIDGLKADIETAATGIETNATNLANLVARVTVNETEIYTNLRADVTANKTQVEANKTNIQTVMDTLASRESYLGYFLHTSTLEEQEGYKGAYAHNAETNTKWVWDVTEEKWKDSEIPIEDQVVDKSTIVPLMDGEAKIGDSNTYAAGDHVHPTDTTRASLEDLNAHVLDTSNPHAVTKEQVGLDQVDNTSDANKPLSIAAISALGTKVDKEVGKVLSSNDYTNEEKVKLANLENFTLPIASDTTLGGLKISGDDFAVSADGTLIFTGSGVGASAYEIAQAQGYTGTEAEWVESLKGKDGTSVNILGSYPDYTALKAAHNTGSIGDAYLIGSNLYVWNTSEHDWIDVGSISGPQGIQGIQGPKGDQGEQGIQGPKGDTGTSVRILGSYNSEEALKGEQVNADLGDAYLVQGDLWVWSGTEWNNVGNISGPKGDTGEQGIQGPKGDPGTSITILGSYATEAELVAAHPTGTLGQGYIAEGGYLYVWNGSTWENVGNISGPQGEQGPEGPQGPKGDTGTITVEQLTDDNGLGIGVKISSDTTGTSATLLNGEDGKAGLDGISPSAKVEETDTGAIITVEDKNGTTTAEIYNGVSGSKGAKGDAGVGIASITKTATTGNVDTYTITYTDNTTQDYSIINATVIEKLSQLENDSGYLDSTAASLLDNLLNYYKKEDLYNKEEIAEMMTNLSVGLKTQVVETLPDAAAGHVDTATMYLIETGAGSHIYEQFMWIGGNWANLGTTSIDLSDYYTTTQIDNKLGLYASIQFVYTLLADYAKTETISTVGKTGSYNDLTDKPTIPSIEGLASVTYVDQKVAAAVDTTALHEDDVATVAKTGKYSDLTDKPTIPSIAGLATTTYVDQQVAAVPIPDLSGYRKKTDVISYNDLSNRPNAYELPVASATTLGGIKIGSGLNMNNGVLSVPTVQTNDISVRMFDKPDDHGYAYWLLLNDITAFYNSTTTGQGHFGFIGKVQSKRLGGYLYEKMADVICRCGYSAGNLKAKNVNSTELMLLTTDPAYMPAVVINNGKYYLAISDLSMGHQSYYDGFFTGAIEGRMVLQSACTVYCQGIYMDKRVKNLTVDEGAVRIISGGTTYTLNVNKCKELGILT